MVRHGMVNDIVKDMVMSKSISSTIIRSNCLSLSPGVPGDRVGDIEDSLGTSLRDTGDSAVDTCRCKTGTTGC